MEQFSDRITFARKRMGLSQSQLATTLGVSRGACGQWEQGVSTPSVSHMAEVARVTEVSFEWLATGRGNVDVDINPDAHELNSQNSSHIAGRPLTGDLREIIVWMQKLPEEQQYKVVKLVRNLRNLME